MVNQEQGRHCTVRMLKPMSLGPVIAIKFINKEHAFKSGRLRTKQLQLELALHASVCPHDNIIRYIARGEDPAWVWMALELAEGGDLFDKIEADEGVAEDVAHLYFTQLMSAIRWCHGKGVAHRDIKPENMLLSKNGDLKLADFGLATVCFCFDLRGKEATGVEEGRRSFAPDTRHSCI
jgi:serine/threonine-protein kinase CHEK1